MNWRKKFMKSVQPRLIRYLHQKAAAAHVPLSGTFELSPCRNMDCKMCYVRKSREEVEASGGEIKMEEWLALAEECREAGMLFLLLTGGEPFLYKDFKTLYMQLSRMGFVITINTNATLIDEKTVEWLKECPPSRMNITPYGSSNETYARLCGNPKGFDRTVHAVRLLKEAGIAVKLNASMTPYNIDDLDGIYETAKNLNVYVQAAAYMFPPVRKSECMIGQGYRFTAEEAAYYQVQIDRKRLTEVEYRLRADKMRTEGLMIQEETDCLRDETEPLRCRAGRSAFWVNWKGEMSACGMMMIPKAYPFRDGLKTAWEQVIEGTEKLHLPAKCVSCKRREVCNVCGASVYTETGGFDEVPDYVCQMTEDVIKYTIGKSERRSSTLGEE